MRLLSRQSRDVGSSPTRGAKNSELNWSELVLIHIEVLGFTIVLFLLKVVSLLKEF